ncbi:MATH domain and coiled-coil domain-containing protein [Cardamine amara subsp. amara]|uniref:MATH domain and coiled-coil domain-containing protein n=1 Tax=Cardamine amara subsp. amara TaxID=228776 RepID=A0ABD0ZX85_CARAN
MWNQRPSLRIEIDHFSEKKDVIGSQTFVSGGCEWHLLVYPKGDSLCDDHLSLYLCVANSSLLQPGWKRSVNYYLVMLNQSKELYRSSVACAVFSAKAISWGYRKTLPLSKFQGKGFLNEDRLIIEVYARIVDGESGEVSEKKDVVYFNGFQVFASQVTSLSKIFAEHPDIAKDFKPKNQVVKTEYMNVLLGLVNTLNKPSKNLSVDDLKNAQSELNELAQVGFKLDWLKTKLYKFVMERMKLSNADGSGVLLGLEERVKNLEEMESNLQKKLDEIDLERKKEKADGSRIQVLEESVKNLKMMVSQLKVKLDKGEVKSSDDLLWKTMYI